MKIKNIIYGILLLSLTITTTACLDINEDPNKSTTAPIDKQLTAGIAGSAYNQGGWYFALGSFWSQYYTQAPGATQWNSWETQDLNNTDFDRQWRSMYADGLQDSKEVQAKAKDTQNWSYYLMATCMLAYDYSTLADLYDKIPYTEANIGNNNPTFDNGEDVLADLITDLDEAKSKNFSEPTVTNPGNQDLIFNGNTNSWKQFANTLQLKLALRFVNKEPSKYAEKITVLLSENNFLNIDASMKAFKDEQNSRNPFYETFIDRLANNIVASSTLIDYLALYQDPRIGAVYTKNNSGTYQGIAQGTYHDYASQALATLSKPNVEPLMPVYFFTKAEVKFLMAEAELRYGSVDKAKVLYESGIEASFTFNNVTGAAPFYATGGPYEFKGLESIIVQKWIAGANTRPLEAFFDKNRTGYPSFFVKSDVSVWPGLPQRLIFPASEKNTNINTPVARQVNEKVWFAL